MFCIFSRSFLYAGAGLGSNLVSINLELTKFSLFITEVHTHSHTGAHPPTHPFGRPTHPGAVPRTIGTQLEVLQGELRAREAERQQAFTLQCVLICG